jgi:hypothetical protein
MTETELKTHGSGAIIRKQQAKMGKATAPNGLQL